MAFTDYLNPSTYIVGGIALAIVGGSFFALEQWGEHYKKLYLQDEKSIAVLSSQLEQMKKTQQNQTTSTGQIIKQIIPVPGPTRTIIKTIHDAPLPQNCETPAIDILRNET